MARIDAFFRLMNAQGASDLHLEQVARADGVCLTMLDVTDLGQ
jgi:hypothetical protein